ncbi:MAG: acyltransferase, partial [Acetivibrio ethanolgignens]
MNRNYSIDVLRIISTIAVVMIHVVTSSVYNSTNVIDTSVENNLELIHALMLWSVPVFFMITGYCLLKKQECTYKYCFSHVLKFLGILFSVGLFYSLLEEIFTAKAICLTLVIKSVLNVISGNLWDHMWFVYSIIGVYLVMPVIHSFMQQGEKNIYILTGLLFLFTIFFSTIKQWLPIGIDFPFGGYLFYVCFGGAVGKCRIKKEVLYLCCLSGGISIVCMVAVVGTYSFGYRHISVCLIAMSIFLLVN